MKDMAEITKSFPETVFSRDSTTITKGAREVEDQMHDEFLVDWLTRCGA